MQLVYINISCLSFTSKYYLTLSGKGKQDYIIGPKLSIGISLIDIEEISRLKCM